MLTAYSLSILLKSSDSKLPPIFSGYGNDLINNIVSIVSLSFAVYVLGHGVAILSSLFIERFLYRIVGTPSTIVIANAFASDASVKPFRTAARKQFRETYLYTLTLADAVRTIFHAPALPVYTALYVARFHGYYESKINPTVICRLKERLISRFGCKDDVLQDSRWFKLVEYACANDHPSAMNKMYNYLMIYGLFRSVSFLVLSVIWMGIYFQIKCGGIGFINQGGHGSFGFRIAVLYGTYTVSFIGFAKFSRRYAEEAIQAFGFSATFSG